MLDTTLSPLKYHTTDFQTELKLCQLLKRIQFHLTYKNLYISHFVLCFYCWLLTGQVIVIKINILKNCMCLQKALTLTDLIANIYFLEALASIWGFAFKQKKLNIKISPFGLLFCDINPSRRRYLSPRNLSIDLLSKSMDWFLYDRDLHHEKVKDKTLACAEIANTLYLEILNTRFLIETEQPPEVFCKKRCS